MATVKLNVLLVVAVDASEDVAKLNGDTLKLRHRGVVAEIFHVCHYTVWSGVCREKRREKGKISRIRPCRIQRMRDQTRHPKSPQECSYHLAQTPIANRRHCRTPRPNRRSYPLRPSVGPTRSRAVGRSEGWGRSRCSCLSCVPLYSIYRPRWWAILNLWGETFVRKCLWYMDLRRSPPEPLPRRARANLRNHMSWISKVTLMLEASWRSSSSRPSQSAAASSICSRKSCIS